MLLYCKHSGQLCNRLWSLVPAVAYAMKNRATLHVLFADEDYLKNFGGIKRSRYVKFWLTKKKWQKKRLIEKIQHFSEDANRKISGELGLHKYRACRIQSIDGWKHGGDISFVMEYKNEIKGMFAFDHVILKKVNDFLGRGNDRITIGVHVRRGDYKQWRDGKFYYDDDTYAKMMFSLKNQFADKYQKQCRFVVCTNEAYNYSNSGLDIMQIPETDAITDLCLLSRCDYIIGPPSTYSQWASFMGDVPLHFILSSDETLKIENFSPIVMMNTFENGRKLIDIVDEKSFIVA